MKIRFYQIKVRFDLMKLVPAFLLLINRWPLRTHASKVSVISCFSPARHFEQAHASYPGLSLLPLILNPYKGQGTERPRAWTTWLLTWNWGRENEIKRTLDSDSATVLRLMLNCSDACHFEEKQTCLNSFVLTNNSNHDKENVIPSNTVVTVFD